MKNLVAILALLALISGSAVGAQADTKRLIDTNITNIAMAYFFIFFLRFDWPLQRPALG